jgi:hypothetical protein
LPRPAAGRKVASQQENFNGLLADKLRQVGVRITPAQSQGIINDFMMLNALANPAAARGAMTLPIAWLRKGFAGASAS